MMKPDADDGLYGAIAAALILGILFSAAFNVYMRERVRQGEGFSELYFEEHRMLPQDMRLGGRYNLSFTFTNHELAPAAYVYAVDSPQGGYSGEVNLSVGGQATILLTVAPTERTWNLTWDITNEHTDRLGGFAGSKTEPLAFPVPGFDAQFLANLTPQDLEDTPYNAFRESNYTDVLATNMTAYMSVNVTAKEADGAIELDYVQRSVRLVLARKPFTIKVYRKGAQGEEELEIHYWQEVR